MHQHLRASSAQRCEGAERRKARSLICRRVSIMWRHSAHLACASRAGLAKPTQDAPPFRRSTRRQVHAVCASLTAYDVFCPRTVSDKPGDAQDFPCGRPGHGGQLWRAPRSESRTVDRGLPGVIASHAQAPHPLHFETPPEAPSLSGYNSYTGLLYNAQEVFVIHMG